MDTTKPPDGPRTLYAAKQLIKDLQAKIGLLRTSGNVPSDPPAPIAKAAAALHPQLKQPLKTEIDLSGLTPRGLRDFFENSTLADLRMALARETGRDRKHQDPAVIASLYKEIKGRRS